MTDHDPGRGSATVPDDAPVTLTPLEGLDLVAVAPRARDGLPVAVRLVDEVLAGEIAGLISEGPVVGADRAPCPAVLRPQHPAETGSSTRTGRALDRLIARARVRGAPEQR